MNRIAAAFVGFALLAFSTLLQAAQTDARGCKDHPLFNRMPGFWIHHCDQKQFDAHDFVLAKDKKTRVEGQMWRLSYYPNNDLKERPSELQIRRNFQNAIQKAGGEVMGGDKIRETFKLTKDGKEIWVEMSAEFTSKHGFVIVQRGAMKQDIVANAEVFSNDIRATGRATIYGLLFDTGKSTIKPESAQVIEEIAKLLKNDAGLKLYVVGHTDNVGGADSNIKLSQERAEAVVQALVRSHGIGAARLRAFGAGLFAPVATNDSDEGRAKNRRVELVKQ